jgi:ubiquinol oxidase
VATSRAAKVPINPSSEFGKPLDESTRTFNKAAIAIIKNSIFDNLYTSKSSNRDESLSRSFARFYALETIARVPYFSYLSVLHLYETFGWFRRASYLKLHFCESWNELHHLLIMEELGGNSQWIDKFFAQHIAFFYYWFVVACYMANPTLAYNLNQAVEEHAYETYNQFLKEFELELKEKESPEIARKYYRDGDLYLFDEMHTCLQGSNNEIDTSRGLGETASSSSRRPKVDTLYDVFVAIREDEKEHVKTMEYLQQTDTDIEMCNT